MAALGTTAEPEQVLEWLAREEGYATPKVDVCAAVFQDGKLLLAEERKDDIWTPPSRCRRTTELPSG